MKIERLATNKLFYKKWIYKIDCLVEGAFTVKYIKSLSLRPPEANKFLETIHPILQKNVVQTRVEGRHFNIFCNDEKLFNDLQALLSQWVVKVHSPATNLEKQFLLDNNHRKILRDRYHKNTFRYKIILQENTSFEVKNKFYDWLLKYDNSKIDISYNTALWLSGRNKYATNPFIYISDNQMLSLVCMYLGNNIKFIEEYVLRHNINTVTET